MKETAVAERGYLWSDKGELSLVAFRTGPYLFRVRDNTWNYRPIAYTFSVAVHAKEAAHGKLP